MEVRNAAICAYYQSGQTIAQTADHFGLGRQRVLQILKRANVWKPYVRNSRTQFLGVSVTPSDKVALRREAKRLGVSMSAMTSDMIRDMLVKIAQETKQRELDQ